MKRIKNMTELKLFRQKLKYRELLLKKDLIGSTTGITDYFNYMAKDFVFDFGERFIWRLFSNKKQKKKSKKKK